MYHEVKVRKICSENWFKIFVNSLLSIFTYSKEKKIIDWIWKQRVRLKALMSKKKMISYSLLKYYVSGSATYRLIQNHRRYFTNNLFVLQLMQATTIIKNRITLKNRLCQQQEIIVMVEMMHRTIEKDIHHCLWAPQMIKLTIALEWS